MCSKLKISRSSLYYRQIDVVEDSNLENLIISIFKASRKNYGTRKIKEGLRRKGLQVSRRRIGRIMEKYSLVSKYTL